MCGFGYSIDVSGSSNTITGLTTSNIQGVTRPDADMGMAPYENDNHQLLTRRVNPRRIFQGGLNLVLQAGAEMRLPSGVYYFDSITLHAGATLRVEAPTTIYVAGDIDASGAGIVNTSEDAQGLTIICGGSTVRLNGSAIFYGQVVAPDADVVLSGTADFYGAVIGGTVWMKGDFEFHVDESSSILGLMGDPPAPMLVR
jgi:hypothetical protein